MDTDPTYHRRISFPGLNFRVGTVVVGEDRFLFVRPGALVVDDLSCQCLGAFVITHPNLGDTL